MLKPLLVLALVFLQAIGHAQAQRGSEAARHVLERLRDRIGRRNYAEQPRAVVPQSTGKIVLTILDAESGARLPARLTFRRYLPSENRARYHIPAISVTNADSCAVRPGVVYTRTGCAQVQIAPGSYAVCASRGSEYSLAQVELVVEERETTTVELSLRHEVDTAGYLAVDTHVHTLTYSGHGDATLEERVTTILGEGLDIAIATDHNHHTDYRPTQEKLQVLHAFTSVIGNEVTTPIGHFNAFPVDPGAAPPEHRHNDWQRILTGVRRTPGVQVIIVNHPRRATTGAFWTLGLNAASGETARRPNSLGVDAVEVLNGKTLHHDYMAPFRDWFGLLNRGEKLVAVAGSDSHTVRSPVGQPRTYVAANANDSSPIKVAEICNNLLLGKAVVSLGLIPEIQIDGSARPGDLLSPGEQMTVTLEVRGPSWVTANSVTLYVNGSAFVQEAIVPSAEPLKFKKRWNLAAPVHDAFIVAIATGPRVAESHWTAPYVLGATNPIWIDGDGDGKFSSAFEYAQRLVEANGFSGPLLGRELQAYDSTIAIQAAALLRRHLEEELRREFESSVKAALLETSIFRDHIDQSTRAVFREYFEGSPRFQLNERILLWPSDDGRDFGSHGRKP